MANYEVNKKRAMNHSVALFFLGGLSVCFAMLLYSLVIIIVYKVSIYIVSLDPNSYNQLDKYNASNNVANSGAGLSSLAITILVSWVICIAFIAYGTISKYLQLRGASSFDLAQLMGGDPLNDVLTPVERRLSNVVEEMCVASNINPLTICISPDQSINSFVTNSGDDYVITVSRGCLIYLNRDELQSVIAHEIGHIKSGDVIINLRLIAILSGFYMINDMLYNFSSSAGDKVTDICDDDNDVGFAAGGGGNIVGAFLSVLFCVAAFVLSCLTSIMIFSGKLMQAAISRQREFLADAYSVQFTRNQLSLVNALKKSYAVSKMPEISKTTVQQSMAHMLFVNYSSQMISTHPSIKSRIARYNAILTDAETDAIKYKIHEKLREYNTKSNLDINQGSNQNSNQKSSQNQINQNVATATVQNIVNPVGSILPSVLLSTNVIPILVIKEVLSSFNKANIPDLGTTNQWILALFAILEKASFPEIKQNCAYIDDDWQKNIEQIQTYLHSQNPLTWIHILRSQIDVLKQRDSKTKLNLLQNVGSIIKLDDRLDGQEISYLALLQYSLANSDIVKDIKLIDLKDEIQLLIKSLARLGANDDKTVDAIYRYGMSLYLSEEINESDCYKLDDKTWTVQLLQAMKKIRRLKPVYINDLLNIIQKTIEYRGAATVSQYNLLAALQAVLKV